MPIREITGVNDGGELIPRQHGRQQQTTTTQRQL